MAGGKERILKERIRTVRATKKITRAMELIAASRLQGVARQRQAKLSVARSRLTRSAEAAGLSVSINYRLASDQGNYPPGYDDFVPLFNASSWYGNNWDHLYPAVRDASVQAFEAANALRVAAKRQRAEIASEIAEARARLAAEWLKMPLAAWPKMAG